MIRNRIKRRFRISGWIAINCTWS